jgi:hypothetical protein
MAAEYISWWPGSEPIKECEKRLLAELEDLVRSVEDKDFITRGNLLKLIEFAFTCVEPDYKANKAKREDRLAKLREKLEKFQRHHPMHAAEQVALEARWLIKHTVEWRRADARLRRLDALLKKPDDRELPQAEDGSWGGAFEEGFLKLEPTIDALQSNKAKMPGLKPLTFMKVLERPDVVLSYLDRLQTSDIVARKRNHRDEFTAVQSALAQLIFKDEIRSVLRVQSLGFEVSPRLEQEFRDFLSESQHPRTGYWGMRYRFAGRLIVQQDLSATFHNIHYLRGSVKRWRNIIDTTLAIKDQIYPGGWKPKEKGKEALNHHNYDIVTIFSYGWPHMSLKQKRKAAKAISEMLRWCLTKSLEGDHFVDENGVDGYYFGVRFLDVAGYWDLEPSFWAPLVPPTEGLPEAADVAQRLLDGFLKRKYKSEMAETIMSILCRAIRLRATISGLPPPCVKSD